MSASVLAGLLIAEGVVRVMAPQQLISYRSDIYRAADTLQYVKRPNVRTTINTGERRVNLITDSAGLRVGARGRIPADRRILLLGDSFMEAAQVEYEQSVAGLLEARLPARIGRAVAVRNAAVVGFGPNQYAVLARRMLVQEPFDLVMVAVCLENDVERRHVAYPALVPKLEHPLSWPDTLGYKGFVHSVGYPINDFLEQRSHLFILVRRASRVALMRLDLSPIVVPIVYYRSVAADPAWDTTAVLLDEVGAAAKAHHVPILYVLLPSNFQVDTADFRQYIQGFGMTPESVDLEQPNRLLGDALRRRGYVVVDVTPPLRAAARRGTRTHGRVDAHLSPEGHALVTEIIAPHIASLIAAQGRGAGGASHRVDDH